MEERSRSSYFGAFSCAQTKSDTPAVYSFESSWQWETECVVRERWLGKGATISCHVIYHFFLERLFLLFLPVLYLCQSYICITPIVITVDWFRYHSIHVSSQFELWYADIARTGVKKTLFSSRGFETKSSHSYLVIFYGQGKNPKHTRMQLLILTFPLSELSRTGTESRW